MITGPYLVKTIDFGYLKKVVQSSFKIKKKL